MSLLDEYYSVRELHWVYERVFDTYMDPQQDDDMKTILDDLRKRIQGVNVSRETMDEVEKSIIDYQGQDMEGYLRERKQENATKKEQLEEEIEDMLSCFI